MKNKKIIIVLLSIIILLSVLGMILARYVSRFTLFTEADIAFFVFETGDISKTLTLESMVPRNEPYVYNIAISNEKDGIITQVPMEYAITIKATTNLPLKYTLCEEGNGSELLENGELIKEDDVYYIVMTTAPKEIGMAKNIHTYNLTIEFPIEYKANSEYADVIELVEITINSKQKI